MIRFARSESQQVARWAFCALLAQRKLTAFAALVGIGVADIRLTRVADCSDRRLDISKEAIARLTVF